MLTKFLITISVLFNPFNFLFSQADFTPPVVETGFFSESNIIQSIELKWDTWKKKQQSSISNLWLSNPNFLPIRNWDIDDPQSQTRAALVFDLKKNKILYEEKIDKILPIASITKLMTALIVLNNIDIEEITVISEEAIAAYGVKGGLVINEKISVKNLLYALLMESSNDAAMVLAEAVENSTGQNFVELMNKKAEELGLGNTYFIDPSGYDPANISTAKDIVQLVAFSLNYPIIWQILKTPTITLFSADGEISHYWTNTDKLLNRLPNIVGGKTGYTEEAQGCLVLVIKQSQLQSNYLITVVLGAQERFLETEKLIEWVEEAYKW